MGGGTSIPVLEYLESSYSPDCDYIHGQLIERNEGEIEHSEIQHALSVFMARYRGAGLRAWPEMRIQISSDHYRVVDFCITEGRPQGPIFTTPPLVCIEILSRKDSLRQLQEVIDDYVSIGVPYCWIIDPVKPAAYIGSARGFERVADRVFRTRSPHPEIVIPVDELFNL
jgi:Uma2 family endonuclease